MQRSCNRTIIISSAFYVLLAVYFVLLPLQWVAAWLAASAVHELSHYAALRLCKVNVLSLRIDISGTKIQTEPMQPIHEAITAVAGPLGGGFLLLFSQYFPRVAICAFVQTVFNLLPIYPLDGGRVCRFVIGALFPEPSVSSICNWLEWIMLFMLLCFACVLSFQMHIGIFPLAVWMIVFTKSGKIKIPCKQRKQIVQ